MRFDTTPLYFHATHVELVKAVADQFLVSDAHCNENGKLDLFDNIITIELSIGDQIGEY